MMIFNVIQSYGCLVLLVLFELSQECPCVLLIEDSATFFSSKEHKGIIILHQSLYLYIISQCITAFSTMPFFAIYILNLNLVWTGWKLCAFIFAPSLQFYKLYDVSHKSFLTGFYLINKITMLPQSKQLWQVFQNSLRQSWPKCSK